MDDRFSYQTRVFEGYTRAAPQLIGRYEALPPEQVLAPVAKFLPNRGARVLDVGAGAGTLAAWFARCGCHVTAVEPVSQFRNHGQTKYLNLGIDWRDSSLPGLTGLSEDNQVYEAVLAIGVLHHLSPEDQETSVRTLSNALKPLGRLILSLRHGPCPPSRPGFPVRADAISDAAKKNGLQLLHRSSNASIQHGNRRAGVTWTWLVFDSV